MRNHVGDNGAIISSCDSDVLFFNKDTYAYVWPRDAAICAFAFDIAGFQEISRLFFGFCDKIISDEGYFSHKYWSDGSPKQLARFNR
jgi:GH15 family glucan-1,4-alpha-glucosidase